MEAGITLVGQSQKFLAKNGGMVQMDLPLSMGQQYSPSSVTYCGKVIDHHTKQAIPEAMVILRNGPYTYHSKTGPNGMFELVLPSHWSVASIQIVKKGYSTRYIGTHFLDSSDQTFFIY